MMKFFKQLTVVVYALFFASQVNAQCGNGATFTVTESRCEATGIITVNGAQGSSLTYDFTSYPVDYSYTGPSASNVITALNPGTYTLRVLDGGSNCFADYTVTVPGTYVQPANYNPTTVDVFNCYNGSNGEIHGVMTDGRAPWTYEIMPGSPAQVGTTNSTGDFTGLPNGTYNLRAYDSCGNFQSRQVTINNFAFTALNPVVTKTACGQYSLDALTANSNTGAMTGYSYKVKDANGATIASGSSLPISFSHPDATIGAATVCITDACGSDNCIPFTLSDWNVGANAVYYTACNTFSVDAVTITGTPTAPFQYGIERAPGDTIWSSTLPFTFTKVQQGFFFGTIVVKDACGVVKPSTNQQFLNMWAGENVVSFTSCTESTLEVAPSWFYINPVTYSLNGGPSQSSGNFGNLVDGTYTVVLTDACGSTKDISRTFDHTWQSQGDVFKHCDFGLFSQNVAVNRRMQVPVTYQQYDATFSSLLSTQTYTDPNTMNNALVLYNDWAYSVVFTSTLPNTTYNYIVTDACGRIDTVTLTNGADGHQPNQLNTVVTPLCINKGNIVSTAISDNPGWNYGLIGLTKFSNGVLTPITWADNFSNSGGVRTWLNIDTGTYIIDYKIQQCSQIVYDTVTIEKYVQPKLRKSIAFPCAGNVVNVVGSTKGGIKPYTYEIFQTVPAGGEQPAQASNLFSFSGTYTLVRMRVFDACGNSSIQDMAVRQPASPSIKVTQKLPVCNLNHLDLYVDSIYQGSQYEWKNPAGAVIATTASLSLPVSIVDTGLYTCRVFITGTCFDKTAEFRLRAKEFGCYAQLGNYVWNDIDQDGVQDANEVGVAGVSVALYDNTNTIIGATVTDAYGYYKFTQLNPGTYRVGFSLPSNYVFTGTDAGSDDAKDSDPNTVSGLTGTYTLAAGDSNMTVDAGIYQPLPTKASLGDYVWNDINKDGIQGPNETGVSGVTVTLYDVAGNPVSTTVTDGNGHYYFNDLTPGTYSVGFGLPVGYVFTPQNQGGDIAKNSDVNIATGKTSPVTLVAGENNPTIDAGIYAQDPIKGALGNYVWNDVNNNGLQDANETGVAGVTTTLYAADGTTVIATTTTDEFGYYIFNNLDAGDYVVGFTNLPSGFSFSPQNAGNDSRDSDPNASTGKTSVITLSQGEIDMTVDAGIYNSTLPIGALGNYVWFDYNENGIQDAGENGVGGVTVTLYDANTNAILAISATDATGKYLFDNLVAGDYKVGFSNLPSGYILTNQTQGVDGTVDSNPDKGTGLTNTIVLGTAEVNLTVDAGIVWGGGKNGTASLGDLVWYDLNNNGIQDNDESGAAGVTVTLYEADGVTVITSTRTDALGNYIFTGLDAGSYVVGFSNIPAGYTFSTANQGTDDELDADADASTGGKTNVYTLSEGEENLTVDAGIFPAPGLASLGNYVWNDLNQDGTQDANEPGVPGVTVTLYNTSGVALATTSTDANGAYQFTGLTPGTYYVEFTNLPAGFEYTDKDAGTDTEDSDADPLTGATPWVTLVAGQNYPDLDAGIYTEKAGLGNYVWNDVDNDGIQDANEVGIAGITVTLYAANGTTPISTAITNAAGYYSFINLDPGTYVVGFSGLPQGATLSSANQGGNDALDSDADVVTGKTAPVTLDAGDYNPTIDAGIHLPNSAGLGNYVWFDANDDGIQNATESGVPGVTVTLYDVNGTPIRTAITTQEGFYSFTNLAPGTYSVGFSTLPLNRGFAKINIGAEGTDSDVENIVSNPITGLPLSGTTAQYTIVAGEYNPNIDGGLRLQFPTGVADIHVKASLSGTTTNVTWATINELDVKYFDIQRSTNGFDFTNVAEKTAKGNTVGSTEYSIADNVKELMNNTTIFYRIKANDVDGKFVYSNVVSVQLTKENDPIRLYPIPFTDKITIEYPSTNDATISVIISDVTGRRISTQDVVIVKGGNSFTIENLNSLSKGSYFVTIKDENKGELFVKKITKQ